MKYEFATFAGGCFWCTEAVFTRLKGVASVKPGYTGGTKLNPTYQEVCSGETGHAEAVKIEFNPEDISYEKLVEVFFHLHDPTTLNRQGNDVGTQYRSVIFYHDEAQKEIAQQVKKKMAKVWDDPIVTEISPAATFYLAESYHQNYFRQHPQQGYCTVVVAPKVAKVRKLFADKLVG